MKQKDIKEQQRKRWVM